MISIFKNSNIKSYFVFISRDQLNNIFNNSINKTISRYLNYKLRFNFEFRFQLKYIWCENQFKVI